MVKVQWSLIRQNKRFLVWALLNRVSADLLQTKNQTNVVGLVSVQQVLQRRVRTKDDQEGSWLDTWCQVTVFGCFALLHTPVLSLFDVHVATTLRVWSDPPAPPSDEFGQAVLDLA